MCLCALPKQVNEPGSSNDFTSRRVDSRQSIWTKYRGRCLSSVLILPRTVISRWINPFKRKSQLEWDWELTACPSQTAWNTHFCLRSFHSQFWFFKFELTWVALCGSPPAKLSKVSSKFCHRNFQSFVLRSKQIKSIGVASETCFTRQSLCQLQIFGQILVTGSVRSLTWRFCVFHVLRRNILSVRKWKSNCHRFGWIPAFEA